jgi:signal peptidase I
VPEPVDERGAVSPEASPPASPAGRSSKKAVLLIVALVLGGALILSPILLRRFVIEAFQIPSGAMTPALVVGDHMLCSKWPQDVRRGDVVVFRYPLDPSTDYVKRVIALAGDTIEVPDTGVVINGQPVARRLIGNRCPDDMEADGACENWEETIGDHTFEVLRGERRHGFGPVVVPAGHVFVMGDNRENSSDSRVWGFLPLANIKAHALLIFWSQSAHGIRWERINRPVR